MKVKSFLLNGLIILIFSSKLFANSYSDSKDNNLEYVYNVSTPTPTVLCGNSVASITFQLNGTFQTGNTFSAELFHYQDLIAPVIVGTVASQSATSLSITIPTGLPNTNGYKIRVIASKPASGGAYTSEGSDYFTIGSYLQLVNTSYPDLCQSNGKLAFYSSDLPHGTYTIHYKKNGVPTSGTIVYKLVYLYGFWLENLEAAIYSDFSVIPSPGACPVVLNASADLYTLYAFQHSTKPHCDLNDGIISLSSKLHISGAITVNYKKNGVNQTKTIEGSGYNFRNYDLKGLGQGTYSDFEIQKGTCSIPYDTTITLTAQPLSIYEDSYYRVYPTPCLRNGEIEFKLDAVIPSGVYPILVKKNDVDTLITLTAIPQEGINSTRLRIEGLSEAKYSDFRFTHAGCTVTDTKIIDFTDYTAKTLQVYNYTGPESCAVSNGNIEFRTNFKNGTYVFSYKKDGVLQTTNVNVVWREVYYEYVGEFKLENLPTGLYTDFVIRNTCDSAENKSSVPMSPTSVMLVNVWNYGANACADDGLLVFYVSDVPNGTYTMNYLRDNTPGSSVFNINNSTFQMENLPAGNYTYFRMNIAGSCDLIFPYENIIVTAPLTGSVQAFPSSCSSNDGSLVFNLGASIEANNYTLSYKKNSSIQSATVYCDGNSFSLIGLSVGLYSDFRLNNGSECIMKNIKPINLSIENLPEMNMSGISHPSSCNTPNGSITFSTTLPAGSYTLVFKKGITSFSQSVIVSDGVFVITGLSIGEYSDFKTIFNGCDINVEDIIVLNVPNAPKIQINSTINATNCSLANGSFSFVTQNLPNGVYVLNYKRNNQNQTKSITINNNGFVLNGMSEGTYKDFSVSWSGCVTIVEQSYNLTCPCSSMLTLSSPSDDYSTGTQTKSAALSGGKIQASNKITGNARITYQAASIELKAGFETASGTVFLAQKGGCN